MGDLLLHCTVVWINPPASLAKSKKEPHLAAFGKEYCDFFLLYLSVFIKKIKIQQEVMTFYINGEKNITQHSKSHQICRISDGRMICKALSPHACCVALRRDFLFFYTEVM